MDEEWIAGDHFQRFNRAIGGNDGVKFDAAFAANLYCERRVDRFDATNEPGGDNSCADAEPFFWARRGLRQIRGGRRLAATHREWARLRGPLELASRPARSTSPMGCRVVLDNCARYRLRRTEMARSRFASAWVGWVFEMFAVNSPGGIRNSRKRDGAVGDVFAFAKERKKNQGGDDQDLESDGDEKRAAFVAAPARFLGGVTFYQTASKKTGAWFGNTSERHHTPPNLPASFRRFAAPASRVANRRPAPLSQGCEVRASSAAFDTKKRNKFPAVIGRH